MYILTNQFWMDVKSIVFKLFGKDLDKIRFHEAEKWVEENAEIIECAGVNVIFCNKEAPERLLLGHFPSFIAYRLIHVGNPVNKVLREKMKSEKIPLSVFRQNGETKVIGDKKLCMEGNIDLCRIDEDVLTTAPSSYFASFPRETSDEDIFYWIKEGWERKSYGKTIDHKIKVKKMRVSRLKALYSKIKLRIHCWIHEIDYQNVAKWAEEHGKRITLDDIGIDIFYLSEEMPRRISKYRMFLYGFADFVYIDESPCGAALCAWNDKLDLRQIDRKYSKFGHWENPISCALSDLREAEVIELARAAYKKE